MLIVRLTTRTGQILCESICSICSLLEKDLPAAKKLRINLKGASLVAEYSVFLSASILVIKAEVGLLTAKKLPP
jgi:hypothetical protein